VTNEKNGSRKLAEITGKLVGVERRAHQNHLQTAPSLEQVANDDHEKVGQRVALVYLVKDHVRRLCKQPHTASSSTMSSYGTDGRLLLCTVGFNVPLKQYNLVPAKGR